MLTPKRPLPGRGDNGSVGWRADLQRMANLTRRSGTNHRPLCVISLNGGWRADPERNKRGRDLGYMASAHYWDTETRQAIKALPNIGFRATCNLYDHFCDNGTKRAQAWS